MHREIVCDTESKKIEIEGIDRERMDSSIIDI